MIDKLKPFLKDGIDAAQLEAVLNELKAIDENFLQNAYLNNDPAVRRYVDKKVGTALDTFKTQTMGPLVDSQVKERLEKHKNETEAEKQLRLINERLDKAENDRLREKHINQALEYAANHQIPTKYVHKLLGSNFEETKVAIDDFVKDFNISVNEEVDNRFKENGRSINYKGNNKPERTSFTREEIAKMSKEDFAANYNKIIKKVE